MLEVQFTCAPLWVAIVLRLSVCLSKRWHVQGSKRHTAARTKKFGAQTCEGEDVSGRVLGALAPACVCSESLCMGRMGSGFVHLGLVLHNASMTLAVSRCRLSFKIRRIAYPYPSGIGLGTRGTSGTQL